MRLAGTCLLILAGGLLGQSVNSRQTARCVCMEELAAALDLLKNEISVHLSPMERAAARVAEQGSGAAADFFAELAAGLAFLGDKSFRELWHAALLNHLTGLPEREQDEVAALGLSLGAYDSAAQAAELERCSFDLRRAADAKRQELQQTARVWPGVGAGLAALLAVLLI